MEEIQPVTRMLLQDAAIFLVQHLGEPCWI
jgi:hypothetical protein